MKKPILLLLLTVLFCSCDKMNDIPGMIISTALYTVIVDDALNDRLNPESPAYFGEEYVKGIELFYLHEGKRVTPYEAYRLSGGGKYWFVDDHNVFNSPVRPDKRSYYDENGILHMAMQPSHGCYFIPNEFMNFADDNNVACYYICYPDGSEDEIKIQLFTNKKGNITTIDKIWVNDEPAFERKRGEKELETGAYYNPKYYPDSWMEYFDGYLRPQNADPILVLTK